MQEEKGLLQWAVGMDKDEEGRMRTDTLRKILAWSHLRAHFGAADEIMLDAVKSTEKLGIQDEKYNFQLNAKASEKFYYRILTEVEGFKHIKCDV